MSRIRILLADRYPEFLEVVADLLADEFEVVGKVASGATLLKEAAALKPDVVVLDLSLCDMTGFEVTRRLLAESSSKIVFLSVYENPDLILAASEAGASGYVFKSQAATELREALLAAARGETYFPHLNSAA